MEEKVLNPWQPEAEKEGRSGGKKYRLPGHILNDLLSTRPQFLTGISMTTVSLFQPPSRHLRHLKDILDLKL